MDAVTRSPHYAHLGHYLPAHSFPLLRFCGKFGDTIRFSRKLSDNNREELSELLLSKSEISLVATSNQVKDLPLQIIIADSFAIHDTVNISVRSWSEYYDLHSSLGVVIFTYDSPMN